MKYQIDQSGKIEDTARPTVLAATNGKKVTVILSANDKKYLQDIYRLAGKPRIFILQVFSACLYLLITKHNLKTRILVDHEYLNHEDVVYNYLTQFAKKSKKDLPEIEFGSIGKENQTHKLSNKSFRNKTGDKKISSAEVLALVILLEA
jgi:hypothetical protein